MGFTLAAAACSRAPAQHAVPFVNAPEELTPGIANWYATTCGGCSAACALLVKTRDGRPIKIEGNPDAPLFGGGTCAVGQATVLSLYDGERLRQPLWRGQPASWADIDRSIEERLRAAMSGGRRVVLLSGTISSPSTRDLIRAWSTQYPGFQHVVYEPVSCAAIRQAYRNGLGRAIVPHYHFDRAAFIVGLEADFLGTWLSPVEFTSQYARRRRAGLGMSRHVQFESGLSVTGANADVRYAVRPSDLGRVALALLDRVRGGTRSVADDAGLAVDAAILDGLANDLRQHHGESLIVSGAQDVDVQTLVAGLNDLLGNIGSTIDVGRPSLQKQADDADMAKLVADMKRGDVHALFVYGVNPAYDYPDAAAFLEGVERVALSVSFADRLDETAAAVHAVCPDHHYLEAWGDAEPVTGCYSLTQPTVAPLFDTRAAQDSLLKWLGRVPDFHTYLRAYWRTTIYPRQKGEPDFDGFWDRTLRAGVLDAPPEPGGVPRFQPDLDGAARRVPAMSTGPTGEQLEAHLHETVAQRDGRHANNPWLQELPDPITKLTWGHALAVAPAAAARLGVLDGDVVAVSSGAVRVELPVCIQPGQAPGTVSIALGYGRTRSGKVGSHVGINAYPLMQRAHDGIVRAFVTGVTVQRTGRREALAATQTHHSMEGRPLVRETTLREFLRASPAELEQLPSLWSEHPTGAHTWGMAIDLGACTGCSACVVACQAENNVPVVGRDEVRRGREMHWIRIDRYYRGSEAEPDTVFQPVMCQHCANAPCETVCPVLATVHSSDGINQQVYNRCIGTRYCENNCPYKVRRFNWFRYAHNPQFDFNMNSPIGTMVLNPDVVVRSRGVMEKCSLCIQRIQAGKLAAEHSGSALRDGDIRTACQQACPAQAIVFGDLQDPESAVARLRRSERHYHLLGQLGTRPNVGYLTKVRNREA
jgi:molybdopterin-containing oxidoreductase family iron-sulfur binding subunit